MRFVLCFAVFCIFVQTISGLNEIDENETISYLNEFNENNDNNETISSLEQIQEKNERCRIIFVERINEIRSESMKNVESCNNVEFNRETTITFVDLLIKMSSATPDAKTESIEELKTFVNEVLLIQNVARCVNFQLNDLGEVLLAANNDYSKCIIDNI